MEISIRLTPYLKINKIKSIDVPKIKRVCPTHSNFIAKGEKFCPHCGAEIVNQEYTVKEELHPYKVFQAAGLQEDNLFTVEYLEGVLKPNHLPPYYINIEEQENMAHNLLKKSDLIQSQILWFKEKYKDYIIALYDAYDAENVEVCWGLLHYWR